MNELSGLQKMNQQPRKEKLSSSCATLCIRSDGNKLIFLVFLESIALDMKQTYVNLLPSFFQQSMNNGSQDCLVNGAGLYTSKSYLCLS